MDLAFRVSEIRKRIGEAERKYGRTSGAVQLLAATKSHLVSDIRAAIQCGITAFGESYVQEALPKISALKNEQVEWHFIGPIQSNKTKLIAQNFSWVHSIDRIKIAERLNEQHSPYLPSLNVCLEVNIDKEATKSGVLPENLILLAQKVVGLPRLKLRGLMAIPAPVADFEKQRLCFRAVADLFRSLNEKGFGLDTLSLGMSNDFEAAIAEGATIVRLGTAIFGAR